MASEHAWAAGRLCGCAGGTHGVAPFPVKQNRREASRPGCKSGRMISLSGNPRITHLCYFVLTSKNRE